MTILDHPTIQPNGNRAKSRGKAPAFQFYAKDFLDGTATMSNAEVGAYIRLLAHSWGNGALPREEYKLARLIVGSVREFRRVWSTLSPKWKLTETGWINERLEQQRRDLETFTRRASDHGKAGANARWGGHSPSNSNGHAQPVPNDGSSVFDLQSSISKDQKRTRVKNTRVAETTPLFAAFWKAYPRKVKKPDTLRAWNAIAPDGSLVGRIMSALEWQSRQRDWLKEGGKFIPYPTSWLNGRRWEDEPFHPLTTEASDDQLERVLSGKGKML
jgi:uncharacterized protein YdaU (DUF1376 family)